jgi:hypothetical protein
MLKQIQNAYGILQHFKDIEDIEDKSWGGDRGDPPDKEDPTTRAFIDGLINIISEIRKGVGKTDAETEVKNANKLVVEVEKLTQGKIISNDTTTAEIVVERLKDKSGDSAQFETFLCCLLMADDSLTTKEETKKETKKGDVFSGVFKVKLRFLILWI